MSRLNEKERTLPALRFFENRNGAETAAILGIGEWAARKRGERALEKLRDFSKHGVTSTTATLAEIISANSVQAAPVALVKTVTAVAIAKGAAAGGSILMLVKGALKLMAWAKAKTAIVVSCGFLLAAGTATVSVVEIEKTPATASVAEIGNPSGYPWQALSFSNGVGGLWGYKSGVLVQPEAPPLMDILLTVARNGEAANSVSESGQDTFYYGFGCTVQGMIMAAYGSTMTPGRIIVATGLPTNRYDYVDNLNRGSTPAFKYALAKKFGITGRIVAVETNVLLLQVANPSAPGWKPSKPDSRNGSTESQGGNSREYHAGGVTLTNWLIYCERTLKTPVIDRTGLTGSYDVDLKWQWGRGQSEQNAFKQAVLDQLGLNLVPGREKIDIVVIKKSTKASLATLLNAFEAASKPPLVTPGQVYFSKASWTLVGYATPKAALESYFWALNKQDTTNLEATMTPGARTVFAKTLEDAGETEAHAFGKLAPMLKKISGYRILETNYTDGIDFQIALDGGVNKKDQVSLKTSGGAGWQVDEIPPHFFEANPQPVMPGQVNYPKAAWAFAGNASPEAALETHFWALNRQDATNFQASLTPGAWEEFTNEMQAGGQTNGYFTETAPALEKISGYRILKIQSDAADEVNLQILMEGEKVKGDEATNELTIKKTGAEWKVDESP